MNRSLVALFAFSIASAAQAECLIGDAVLKSQAPREDHGIMNAPVENRALLGKEFRVVRYGEKLELRYNPANDSYVTVGHKVAEIKNGRETYLVGQAYGSGQPVRWDTSWKSPSEIQGTRWFSSEARTPRLRQWSGAPIETGQPVYTIIQSGPLKGLQLVLADCKPE